ncbi:hypothetical protein ABW13_24950 [Pluralibacter gergoviae]|nr:hypothetical protein ABW13_24950 [Pluralibacter gergoviae]
MTTSMISIIAVVIMLRLIGEPLLMGRIMAIWRFLEHRLISIAVAEGQSEVVQFFSSFQQIMDRHLYIKS